MDDGNDEITVKLYDGREFKAEVVGTDQETDLALLKVNSGTKLPVL
jgi:serine protease Do